METQSDHDLLVRLDEQLQFVRDDIKELKDGTKTQLNDHESRLKLLELSKSRYFWTITVYSSIGVTLIALVLKHIFQ